MLAQTRLTRLAAALLLLAPRAAWAQERVAIVGAMVVDGTGAAVRPATVVLRGEAIESVSADVAPPQGARLIDAGGQTLLPGLFDLHTHLPYSAVTGFHGDWGKILKAYLYCGVTTVVDYGIYTEMFEPMRKLLRDGVVPGPRVQMAARLTTPLGHGAEGGRGDFFSLQVQTPREARAAMRRLLPYKPDVIKVFTDGWRYGSEPDMTSMEFETLKTIVEAAHAAGVEVATHTVTREKAKIAARADVDVIAHGVGDASADADLLELMKKSGTTYVPTLAVYEPRTRGPLPPLLRRLLEPEAIRILEEQAARPAGRSPVFVETRKKRWDNLMSNTAAMRTAGIPFGVGTDAGVTGAFHGYSTLKELNLLVEGGLTPLEALTASTGNSARALKLDAGRGFVRPGMLADLVLVEGRPFENMEDIYKVKRVFLGGREVDRVALAEAISKADVTPLPALPAPALVDDFEDAGGRTRTGSLVVNATEEGSDNTRMTYGRLLRVGGGHALSLLANMSHNTRPFARVNVPLTPGGVLPVDASRFEGVRFEARGEGDYRLFVEVRAVRDGVHFNGKFAAGARWRPVRIPFRSLERPGSGKPVNWSGRDLVTLGFEVSRGPGEFAWLEIDNVGFY